MGGPCLSIYTPKPLSDDKRKKIRTLIKTISSHVDGDDFWIGGVPLAWSVDEPYDEDKEIDIYGWSPKADISVMSFINSPAAHVLVATIAINIAELTHGYINLDIITTVVEGVSESSFTGWKYVKWFNGDKELPIFIVEPKALGSWLAAKEFRLVK